MGLKLLHSADWHLGSPLRSLEPELRERLRQAQRRLPGEVAKLVREHHCDLVLLSGDLLEGNPGKEWIRLLSDAFRDMAVPVMISPGNHDFCCPGSPWLEEVWPENVHIFTGSLESVVIPELDCRVYGAGYSSMDCPPLLEGFRAEGDERHCVAVLHGDPLVKNSPCCPVTAAQVRDSALCYLALGHIHGSGSFRSGSTLCGWPGCPMGRGWDETGPKGVYLVTLEDTPRLEQIKLDLPCFYDLTAEIGDDLYTILPPTATGDIYRLTLTGLGRADLSGIRKVFSHLNLELVDRTVSPETLWAQAGDDSFRGVYFRLLRESGSDAAELAAAISLRLLDGSEVALS